MSDMVERVARAMTRANYSVFEWTEKQLAEMVDRDWYVSIPQAQAAIAAMQADAAPVVARVSTPNPVVDHGSGNMSDKLRPAVEVWRDAYDAFTDFYHHTTEKDPARVIEADRQATRAALVAEIVEWLKGKAAYAWSRESGLADEIAAKWGKQ